jgi:hypothetical protein
MLSMWYIYISKGISSTVFFLNKLTISPWRRQKKLITSSWKYQIRNKWFHAFPKLYFQPVLLPTLFLRKIDFFFMFHALVVHTYDYIHFVCLSMTHVFTTLYKSFRHLTKGHMWKAWNHLFLIWYLKDIPIWINFTNSPF